jgi:hypothetical protein
MATSVRIVTIAEAKTARIVTTIYVVARVRFRIHHNHVYMGMRPMQRPPIGAKAHAPPRAIAHDVFSQGAIQPC